MRIKTLASRAAEAKADGLSEVVFSTPEQIRAFSTGFLDAATRYSVVIGRLSATQALADKREITTWYALDIEQVLTEHNSLFVTFQLSSVPATERPAVLLPLDDHQMLVVVEGGKATIDGVSMIERENGNKPLQLDRRYLFILETSPDGLARLPFGQAGVFGIASDEDSLSPMSSLSGAVSDDVKATYSRSLFAIRQELSNR